MTIGKIDTKSIQNYFKMQKIEKTKKGDHTKV